MMQFSFVIPVRWGLMGGLALALAACGGGAATTPVVTQAPTIPTPSTPTPTPSAPTVPTGGTGGAMRDAATALVSTYAPSNLIDYTPLSSVPTSGNATYDGYFYGDVSNGTTVSDSLIGDLQLTASFTAGSANISGTVSNVVDNQNRTLTGTLALSAGALDRAGTPAKNPTLTATASGTLTNAASQAMVFGTQLEGDFLSGTAAAVGGEVLGGVTIAGTDYDFDGGFIAEE